MPYPADTYIIQLRALQADLFKVMNEWSSVDSFAKARKLAEASAPLIAGEIASLQKAKVILNLSEREKLRAQLDELCTLMKDADKIQFLQYIGMLDSLINEGVSS